VQVAAALWLRENTQQGCRRPLILSAVKRFIVIK
jgi:hypothetical protein